MMDTLERRKFQRQGRRDMEKRVREARRAAVVDMSAEAVDARLRELSEMSRLCASLASAQVRPSRG